VTIPRRILRSISAWFLDIGIMALLFYPSFVKFCPNPLRSARFSQECGLNTSNIISFAYIGGD
jgi:hypothetical protein